MANEIQKPSVTQWQKAMPMILSLVGAILAAWGTGNWVNVGTAALKDIPTILATLGLSGGGLLSLLFGLLGQWNLSGKVNDLQSRLNNRRISSSTTDPVDSLTLGGVSIEIAQDAAFEKDKLVAAFTAALELIEARQKVLP